MMGNHTSINPGKTKATVVHAAEKFKHSLMNKHHDKTDTTDVEDLIRCIVNSYFKKKNECRNNVDRFDDKQDVLELSDDGEAILKYITRYDTICLSVCLSRYLYTYS